MTKRLREGDVLVCRPDMNMGFKRGRFESLKRSAPFDMEVERMTKRMRATVPTAEEAMAFLLPHLIEFRKLYLEEKQRNAELEQQVKDLRQGYDVLLKKSVHLHRQLDLAKYHLAFFGPKPSSVS